MRNAILALVFLVACAGDPELSSSTDELAAPRVVLGPVVAAEFADGFAIHGVGGDEVLLFAVQPTDAPARARGVHVARRLDGASAGDVPPPPGGWGTPLTIKIEGFQRTGPLGTQGTFVLMDAATPPALAGTAPVRLFRYRYAYAPATGLSAEIVATGTGPLISPALIPAMFAPPPRLLPDGVFYAGSIALLPGGGIALTDTLAGAVWTVDAELASWRLAWFDDRLRPGPGGPIEGVGRAPGGGTRPYTLLVPSQPGLPPIYPGAHSITYAALTDEIITLTTTSPGGIWALPRAALLDGGVAPDAKAALVRVVIPPAPGLSDLADGLDADRFHPASPWLYWQRAPSDLAGGGFNTLRRVNVTTGAVEVVARSNEVFDWANEISVLPPMVRGSPMTTILSSVGQEENNPDVNVLLGGVPAYVAPSLMPVTLVTAYP